MVLVSIILAGINRNTGLVFDTSSLSSVDFRRWFGNYLAFGEAMYDKVVSLLKMTGYFKQRNLMLDFVSDKADDYLKQQTGRSLADFTKREKKA